MKHLLQALFVAGIFLFTSCSKNEDQIITPPTNDPGDGTDPTPSAKTTIVLRISSYVNGTALYNLDPNKKFTHNVNGVNQRYTISKLKYYVSNVVFISANGSEYAVPGLYHLIDQSDFNKTEYVHCQNIPNGTYSGVRFTVGVDSARVVNGPQSGDLDPAKGMYWNNADGYIAFLMEGTTEVAGVPDYRFHVGGYSGGQNALRTITKSFNGLTVTVDGVTKPMRPHFRAELGEVLTNPTLIDFVTTNNIQTPGVSAITLADNYSDMFLFEHLDTIPNRLRF